MVCGKYFSWFFFKGIRTYAIEFLHLEAKSLEEIRQSFDVSEEKTGVKLHNKSIFVVHAIMNQETPF